MPLPERDLSRVTPDSEGIPQASFAAGPAPLTRCFQGPAALQPALLSPGCISLLRLVHADGRHPSSVQWRCRTSVLPSVPDALPPQASTGPLSLTGGGCALPVARCAAAGGNQFGNTSLDALWPMRRPPTAVLSTHHSMTCMPSRTFAVKEIRPRLPGRAPRLPCRCWI